MFYREIEIIKPTLIVAFGQKVHHLLQFSLAGSGIKVERVWHYAYTRRSTRGATEKELEFENQIRRVLGK